MLDKKTATESAENKSQVVAEEQKDKTEEKKVNDYLIWSLLSLIFCNVFCLGWVALFYSLRARFSKHIDVDEEAGEHFAEKAKECNIQLLISGSMVFSILIVLAIIRGMVYYYTIQNALSANSTVALSRSSIKC